MSVVYKMHLRMSDAVVRESMREFIRTFRMSASMGRPCDTWPAHPKTRWSVFRAAGLFYTAYANRVDIQFRFSLCFVNLVTRNHCLKLTLAESELIPTTS